MRTAGSRWHLSSWQLLHREHFRDGWGLDHNGQKSVHMADMALVCNYTRPFLCAAIHMNRPPQKVFDKNKKTPESEKHSGTGLLRQAAVHSFIALMVFSFLLLVYGNKFLGSSVTENTSAAVWLKLCKGVTTDNKAASPNGHMWTCLIFSNEKHHCWLTLG